MIHCHGDLGHLPNARTSAAHSGPSSTCLLMGLVFLLRRAQSCMLTLVYKRQSPSFPSGRDVGAGCLRGQTAEAGEAAWLCSLLSARNYLRECRR